MSLTSVEEEGIANITGAMIAHTVPIIARTQVRRKKMLLITF